MSNFDYQQLLQATQAFSSSTLIGKGSHGSIHKAVLKDAITNNIYIVAVKKSSSGVDHISNDNSKKLENEISILSSLSQSPYIINTLGTSYDEEKKSKVLVMEFMPNGSLHDLLHNGTIHGPPSWPKRVEVAIHTARAIHFLHETNNKPNCLVIHRDIKSSNILFDSNWHAKLTDFGLAVSKLDDDDDSASHHHPPAGTIGYMDPCYTIPTKLNTRIDVYSYGVMLLELISGRKAIDVSKAPASIVEWAVPLIEKRRELKVCDSRISLPTFMEGTIKHMLYVAASCVSLNEEKRPSVSEIVSDMERYYMAQIERVKMPSWVGLIRSVVGMRRQRKLAKKWRIAAQKCEVRGELLNGKVLLRDILTEITIKS